MPLRAPHRIGPPACGSPRHCVAILPVSLLESRDVAQRHGRDGIERFPGKECLVPGYDDIGERQQAGKYIVLQHLVRKILKKEIGFFFVYIQPQITDLTAFETVNDRSGVNQSARLVLISMTPLFICAMASASMT